MSPVTQAIEAIDGSRSNRAALVRAAGLTIIAKLRAIAPDLHVPDAAVEAYVEALRSTEAAVFEFATVARHAAEHGDEESCRALFECVVQAAQGLLDPPVNPGAAQVIYDYGYDFWRVITLELHLLLIAPLLVGNRLLMAGRIARLPCVVHDRGNARPLTLSERSTSSWRLRTWAKGAASPIGKFFLERYAPGSTLSAVTSFAQIADADVFLMLAGGAGSDGVPKWTAFTLPALSETPRFIANVASLAHASQLAEALNVPVEELRTMIRDYPRASGVYFGSLGFRLLPFFLTNWDASSLGTVP